MQYRHSLGITLFVAAAMAPALRTPQDDDRARVLALADSALVAITRGDPVALTDLMVEEAVMFPVGPRGGEFRHSVRTRAAQRESPLRGIVERGFRGEAKVSGPVAMVWLPYDLYVNGNWSHCGVDIFTFVRTSGAWKIASLAWSVEQPPACERHPDGPPRR